MQNVDELKTRVEETAEKLRAFQEGRNGQSQSLVEMLSQLEEKYAAQSVELEYCRERIDPLETANAQLAVLMESLLDTIDAGFANIDGDPLQKAADIAGSMLVGEMSLDSSDVQTEDPIEDEVQPIETEVPEELIADAPVSQEEIEKDAIEETEVSEFELMEPEASTDEALESVPSDEDERVTQFEDVSEAALELEAEEDAPTADLPEQVVTAIADTEVVVDALDNAVPEIAEELVSDELVLEDAIDIDTSDEMVASADDLDSVAALAQEIEEEVAETEDQPAASDIRALLERVEALAAKAGAMGGDDQVEPAAETVEDDGDVDLEKPREAGAAA
ncbi:MAG: hypothetical protein GKS01_12145 [Alphaproteobacteria bacterium]|nr:hypothetical protein [Alphaproteobacteria bacterium]